VRTKVHKKNYDWSVGLVYNPTRLSRVTINMPEVAGVLQNGIRVDTHGFTMRMGQLRRIRWHTGQGRGYVRIMHGSSRRDLVWYVCY
jgi:hypothetical protein